jgi:CheY-like chemotaxis protein
MINPNARVILASGYSLKDEPADILEHGCDAFIQKPFQFQVLAQNIEEILGDT